jgi:hypothetical protein
MTTGVSRAEIELEQLPSDDITAEDVVNSINKTNNFINFLSKNISLQSNFNCFIAEVEIPATSQLQIQHYLGVVPKYRIILRQQGNGVLTDIPSGWTNKVITLYNNGAVTVTATIMIVRE